VEKALDILKELSERDGDCRTDLKAAVGAMMFAFDGPAGLARFIKLEFDHAPEGSTVRTKILTTILDLMKDAGEDEGGEFEPEDYAAMERQMGGGNGSGV
jgi:hypothetical protein